MLKPIRSLICRHDFYWSERHGADICRHCRHTRAAAQAEPPLRVLMANEGAQRQAEPAPAPWPPAEPLELDIPTAAAADEPMVVDFDPSELDAEPAPPAPRPDEAARRARLAAWLDTLSSGGALSRAETIETVLALIEDGHSSDPQVFGLHAPETFARLHASR